MTAPLHSRARRALELAASWAILATARGAHGEPSTNENGTATAAPPPFKPLRYDEDASYLADPTRRTGHPLALEPLKYIAFGDASYLSFGGEIREQYERYNNPDFGLVASEDNSGYLLQRYLLHADLHLGSHLRGFAQLKSNLVSFQGSPTGPADEDRLDAHQAFIDLRMPSTRDGDEASLVLRVGRQEMLYGSQRLISVREGPNVRRTFDVVRVLSKFEGWRLDGFVGWPVETDPGVFDDGREEAATTWGAYATTTPSIVVGLKLDLYYLGIDRPNASFDQGTADERRHSIGMRVFSEGEALDYNFELLYQWGRFGSGNLRAWTIASDTGYTFATHASPRIALRADITSGDDNPADLDLGTFNPLFPKGNYFGESALLGPVNLIDLHPIVQLHISDAFTIEASWTWYWRESTGDGVYGVGVNLIQGSAGSDERHIGSELSLATSWQVHRHIALSSSYSHFYSGAFLADTGPGRSVDYITAFVTYQF